MTEKVPVLFDGEIIHISYKEVAPDLPAAEFIIFRIKGKVCHLFFSLYADKGRDTFHPVLQSSRPQARLSENKPLSLFKIEMS